MEENKTQEYVTNTEDITKILKGDVLEEQPKEVFKPNPIWDKAKEKYGETFKMPENITKDNEFDVFTNVMAELNKKEPEVDGIAKEIYQLQKEGKFNEEEFFETKIKEKQLKNLPSKDFMFEVLKKENGYSEQNPNGWKDEDINQYIEGKSKVELDIMAQQKKEELFKKPEVKEKKEEQIEDDTKVINDIISRNTEKEVIKQIIKDESLRTQLNKEFEELVKIDKNTKTNKLAEMIYNDDTLYEMVMVYKYHLKQLELNKKIEADSKNIDKNTLSGPPRSSGGGVSEPVIADAKNLI